MMITAKTMYDLEKSGGIKRLNRHTDHKRLKIYAAGAAGCAISATLLKNRRDDAKRFMNAICEGIALAIEITAALIPAAANMKPQDLVDGAFVAEREKQGRCRYSRVCGLT